VPISFSIENNLIEEKKTEGKHSIATVTSQRGTGKRENISRSKKEKKHPRHQSSESPVRLNTLRRERGTRNPKSKRVEPGGTACKGKKKN